MKIFPILAITCIILASCQSDKTQPEKTSSTAQFSDSVNISTDPLNNASTIVQKKYIALVSDLRVRNVPDKEGEILGRMQYAEKATYLGEESDFKEKIKIRGQIKYDTWKKIKTYDTTSQQEIEGWVFGGGIMPEEEIWIETSPSVYQQKIIAANSDELSELIGIKIEGELLYDGIIHYKKTSNGTFVKDGKFSAKGIMEINISKNEADYVGHTNLSGNYSNGVLNGVVERQVNSWEYYDIITVNYEKGTCLWCSFMGGGEGDEYTYREDNPKDCSFDYVEKKLAEKYNWN